MLVIFSDTHLTDGSSGQTVNSGAFRVFRERLCNLAWPMKLPGEKTVRISRWKKSLYCSWAIFWT